MYDIAVKSEKKLNVGVTLHEECTAAISHMVYELTWTSAYGEVQ